MDTNLLLLVGDFALMGRFFALMLATWSSRFLRSGRGNAYAASETTLHPENPAAPCDEIDGQPEQGVQMLIAKLPLARVGTMPFVDAAQSRTAVSLMPCERGSPSSTATAENGDVRAAA